MWQFDLIVHNIGAGHAFITSAAIRAKTNSEDLGTLGTLGWRNSLVQTGGRKDLRFELCAPATRDFIDAGNWGYMIDVSLKYTDVLGNRYRQLVRACASRAFFPDAEEKAGFLTVQMFDWDDAESERGDAHPFVIPGLWQLKFWRWGPNKANTCLQAASRLGRKVFPRREALSDTDPANSSH